MSETGPDPIEVLKQNIRNEQQEQAQREQASMAWLAPGEQPAFSQALATSERWPDDALAVRNSVTYLEGLLERTTFPDDDQARALEQQLVDAAADLQSDGKPVFQAYQRMHQLRHAYAATARGDLAARLNSLYGAEHRLIAKATANHNEPSGVSA